MVDARLKGKAEIGTNAALGTADAQFISCGHSMGKAQGNFVFLCASCPLALLRMLGVLTSHETY